MDQLPEKYVKEKMPAGAKALNVLDVPLDFNTMASLGWMLGAAFVVYGHRRNMLEHALNCVEFYRNESCGKCVPCRMGSQKLVDILHEMLRGQVTRAQLPLINEVGQAMTIASICGLGMVAANPILYVLKYFKEDVEKVLKK